MSFCGLVATGFLVRENFCGGFGLFWGSTSVGCFLRFGCGWFFGKGKFLRGFGVFWGSTGVGCFLRFGYGWFFGKGIFSWGFGVLGEVYRRWLLS